MYKRMDYNSTGAERGRRCISLLLLGLRAMGTL